MSPFLEGNKIQTQNSRHISPSPSGNWMKCVCVCVVFFRGKVSPSQQFLYYLSHMFIMYIWLHMCIGGNHALAKPAYRRSGRPRHNWAFQTFKDAWSSFGHNASLFTASADQIHALYLNAVRRIGVFGSGQTTFRFKVISILYSF